MEEKVVWFMIMIPVGALFTGLGIFAWRRKKPMWFWSGSTVSEREISDVHAYNRANGIMWLCYSAVFWVGAFLAFADVSLAGIVMASGCIVGIPILAFVYGAIYKKYRKHK